LWTLPTGTVGSTGSLDSGSLSGRTIVISYTSNAAATTDSIRVRYTSGCGNSGIKAQKLSNISKTCFSGGTEIFSRKVDATNFQFNFGKIYPNPNNGSFIFEAKVGSTKSGFTNINLFNTSGKLIYKSLVKIEQGKISEKVDCKNIKSGVYFLKYTLEDIPQTIKMIVE
jgi:hypothetical protein